MHRTCRQKVNKHRVDLNNITDQMDLTDKLKTFYPMAGAYTFLSTAHRNILQYRSRQVKNKVLTNLRRWKSQQESFSNYCQNEARNQQKKNENSKYGKIKPYTLEQPMVQRRNHKGN